MVRSNVLEALASARQIANHAESLGVAVDPAPRRCTADHLGAVLADAILQAGLNYRTVVKPRVSRIESKFPCSARISGVMAIIDAGILSNFLLWSHPEKLNRFVGLSNIIYRNGVDESSEFAEWISGSSARDQVLSISGIGPKTFDYLCCLVGLDRIPVDRHIKGFVGEAGVFVSGYENIQEVVSYAADLLGLSRRDFDAWIWRYRVSSADQTPQYQLF